MILVTQYIHMFYFNTVFYLFYILLIIQLTLFRAWSCSHRCSCYPPIAWNHSFCTVNKTVSLIKKNLSSLLSRTHNIRISLFVILYSFSFFLPTSANVTYTEQNSLDKSDICTYRVHEHFVFFVLLWIQHIVALLAKSNTDKSRAVVVRVVAGYLRWHDCAF